MPSFGDSTLKLQQGSTYEVARNGLATRIAILKGQMSGSIPYTQGDTDPDYPNTVLMQCRVEVVDAGCNEVKLTLTYQGYDDNFTNDEVRLDGQLDCGLSTEPIETHEDFLKFAGERGEDGRSANLGLNGAVYREVQVSGSTQYEFDFFTHSIENDGSTVLNRFSGVKSFYFPTQTYTQTRIDLDWPSADDLSYLGKILDSQWLDSNVPMLPTGMSWLYSGVRSQNIGNVYFVNQRTAITSGPRGWVPQIYQRNYAGSWTDQSPPPYGT